MKEKLKKTYEAVGLPRLLIICFFLALLLSSGSLELSIPSLLGDTVRRWVMYGILVLAMVPAVQCGIGLNFGVSLGIVGGLLGATIAIELEFANPWISLAVAMMVGTAIATVFGMGYGLLLNRVKGSEMTVSTYVGFSTIAFMNIVWLSLPYKNGEMIWPLGGAGLRNTINLNSSFGEVLSNTPLSINISQQGVTFGEKAAELNAAAVGFYIPTAALLLFFAVCFLMWLFMRSKVGLAMSAAGANPKFAQATGINVNNMRILGTTISTALGGAGIVLYAQSYGFLQLYNAPLMMSFHCVAAILIGGASIARARISHVLLGTFLFQGLLAVALPVVNKVLPEGNLSDIIRIIISYGIILYALSKTKQGGKGDA